MSHNSLRSTLTVLLIVASSVQARAQSVDESISIELSGFEEVPTLEDLTKKYGVAPATAAVLALADDESARPFLRTRALALLGQSESPEALPVIRRALSTPEQPFTILFAAVGAAGAKGNGLVEALRPHLDSEDVHLREVVIRSLAKIGTPEGKRLLATRRSKETSPMLKRKLAELDR
jgi:HEAT repeat protein